ncbi:MAG: hypothetical protein C0507_10670 [Cyanobacteria bacterium PR.3.49]|nr:hypothetical protein [Cyanobacteria bacterium PR.3.49]
MFEKWQNEMDQGNLAFKMRDFAAAEKHFAAAIEMAEKFGHNNLSLAQSAERMGDAIMAQPPLENERAEECFSYFQHACGIYEATHGPIDLKVAECLTNMSKLLLWFNVEETEKFLRRAMSIYEELNSDRLIEPAEVLISLLQLDSRKEESAQVLAELVKKFEAKADTSPLPLAVCLASHARRTDENAVAIPHYKRALKLLAGSSEHTALKVEIHVALGRLLFQEEESKDAERNFQKAMDMGECAPDVSAMVMEEALCRMARLQTYYYQDYKRAEDLLKRAEEIRDPNGQVPIGSGVHAERGFLARASGNFEKYAEEMRLKVEEAREAIATDSSEWKDLRTMTWTLNCIALAPIELKFGNREEAYRLWKIAMDEGKPGSWMVEKARFAMALAIAKSGDLDKAKALADEGLKLVNDGTTGETLSLMVLVEHALGRTDHIEMLIEECRKQSQKAKETGADEYGSTTTSMLNFALALAGAERSSEADKVIDDVFALHTDASIFRAVILEEWANVFDDENLEAQAARLREQSKAIRTRIYERDAQLSEETTLPA